LGLSGNILTRRCDREVRQGQVRARIVAGLLSCTVFAAPWHSGPVGDYHSDDTRSRVTGLLLGSPASAGRSRTLSRPGLATLGTIARQKTLQELQQAQAILQQMQQVAAMQQRMEQLAQKVITQQKQVQKFLEDQGGSQASGNQAGGNQAAGNSASVESDPQARQRVVFREVISKLARHKHHHKQPEQAAPSAPVAVAKLEGVGNSAAMLGGPISKLGGPQAPKRVGEIAPAARASPGKGRILGGRPAPGALLPPIGSFKPNEVLAINLNETALQAAVRNSFTVVENTELPALGLKITQLIAPEGENAINGRNKLYDLVPDGDFTINRVYAPYRMGLGLGAPVKAGGCGADRCFGASLIKWQPELAACAREIRIGIVDTGYDHTHPTFKHLLPVHKDIYKEFVPAGAKLVPQHGTAVLSVMAGYAQSTTPGLIPDAEYRVANAFYADPGGHAMSDTTQILRALDWLMDEGVAVVNLSFSGPEDDLIHAALKRLTSAGIIVVAAAGNDGPRAPPSYPAAYKEVIAVTAVDRNRSAYPYANRGAYVDVAAPGVGVWTALPGKREGAQTGTSFAVPYVTAVLAMNYPAGLGESHDPTRTKQIALASIVNNVKGLAGQGLGAGLVQAADKCGARPGEAVAGPEPKAGEARPVAVKHGAPKEAPVLGPWSSVVQAGSGE
jgi:hypothetical protein